MGGPRDIVLGSVRFGSIEQSLGVRLDLKGTQGGVGMGDKHSCGERLRQDRNDRGKRAEQFATRLLDGRHTQRGAKRRNSV